ncbi:hypothetical protein WICMUC_003141 [Wickerhamomyces mucosus]|uniref:Secreted protein n=1 Tax=Wickerhamomyces mucosus TaxID=1378264 RepID=A0A9P8PN99_9ASCO|nr:hypothetical protein WICMUC_003141 [Wickerhamomyces mucosus]
MRFSSVIFLAALSLTGSSAPIAEVDSESSTISASSTASSTAAFTTTAGYSTVQISDLPKATDIFNNLPFSDDAILDAVSLGSDVDVIYNDNAVFFVNTSVIEEQESAVSASSYKKRSVIPAGTPLDIGSLTSLKK